MTRYVCHSSFLINRKTEVESLGMLDRIIILTSNTVTILVAGTASWNGGSFSLSFDSVQQKGIRYN